MNMYYHLGEKYENSLADEIDFVDLSDKLCQFLRVDALTPDQLKSFLKCPGEVYQFQSTLPRVEIKDIIEIIVKNCPEIFNFHLIKFIRKTYVK